MSIQKKKKKKKTAVTFGTFWHLEAEVARKLHYRGLLVEFFFSTLVLHIAKINKKIKIKI
jgi:hypothetical protein